MKKSQLEDQLSKFIETARELDCDEDEAAFEEKLWKVVSARESLDKAGNPVSMDHDKHEGFKIYEDIFRASNSTCF